MSAEMLLTDLRARGVRIEPRSNGNLYVAPKDRVTPELAEMIRQHKAALLALLHADAAAEGERIARLDTERRAADRHAKRGYDFDATAPSHADYLPAPGHPAYAVITTCQRYGVALRIDAATGDLVVGKLGAKAEEPTQPWPSLIVAIEAHLEAVARLVEAGWILKADFPRHEMA